MSSTPRRSAESLSHVVTAGPASSAESWLVGVGSSDAAARKLAEDHNARRDGAPLTWREVDVSHEVPEERPVALTRGSNKLSKRGGDTYWIRVVETQH